MRTIPYERETMPNHNVSKNSRTIQTQSATSATESYLRLIARGVVQILKSQQQQNDSESLQKKDS